MEILLVILAHFIPTIIAFCRGHQSKWGIFAMNLLLGWTVVFWIWAFIWSLSGGKSGSVTVINNNNLNGG